MTLTFLPMDEATARTILAWRYEQPYALYNHDPAGIEDGIRAFTDPANAYYSVVDEDGHLVAYRCFGLDAQVAGGDYSADALDTGGGLRPDLTGRGLGLSGMQAGLDFSQGLYHPRAFRVTVAAFNLRAQRVCERAGFRHAQRFVRPTDGREFVILLRPL